MSYNRPNTVDESAVFDLNSGQRVGVIFAGLIGTISTTSVAFLLVHLFTVSFVSGRINANKDERIFLRMHLGAFVFCLLCSDLIQGISGTIQLEWARRHQVQQGPLCTAQAGMIMFGDVGTAFWNAVIGIHTFWTVVLRKRMSTVAVAFLIATGWTMCVILTAIGPVAIQTPERGPFYSIAGAWCFVTTEYKDYRIYLHYIPTLLSGFLITVLYVLVALALFGILVVDGKQWRFKAPTGGFRELIGQFSLGRITRATTITRNQTRSSRIRSLSGRMRVSTVGPKLNETKRTDDLATVATVQTIDIAPSQSQLDSNYALSSPTSPYAFDRGRSSESKTLCEPKVSGLSKEGKADVRVSVATTPITTHSRSIVQVTGQGVPLKQLAIKLLWYPIIYLLLMMPITITRVDVSLNVELSVMLAFMCLLWSMGTANTIIYLCTRRLGPNPWSRRHLSLSRSRSRTTRKEPGLATAVRIHVEQSTQHAIDEDSVPVPRERGLTSILTNGDISLSDSTPTTPVHKVGFEFGGLPHHIPRSRPTSAQTAFSPPPTPTTPQRLKFEEPHPYAQARSPQAYEP